MATVKPGYPAFDSYVAYSQESTFGTAIADNGSFISFKLLDNNVPYFTPPFYIDDSIKNNGVNILDVSDVYASHLGQWRRYSLPATIASSRDLAHMLYGVIQSASEGAASPYLKTYTQNGTIKPDFSSSAGYFFTLLVKEPYSSTSRKLTSCVVESLQVKFSPDNGGRCIISGDIISGKAFVSNSNPTGTIGYSNSTVPNFFDSNASTLSINSIDLIFYEVTINYRTYYDFTGHTSGYADTYNLVRQSVSANVVCKYDSNSYALLDLVGSTTVNFVFNIGINSAAGYYSLNAANLFVRNATVNRGGNDSVQKISLDVDFLIVKGSSYITTYCADGVDANW